MIDKFPMKEQVKIKKLLLTEGNVGRSLQILYDESKEDKNFEITNVDETMLFCKNSKYQMDR